METKVTLINIRIAGDGIISPEDLPSLVETVRERVGESGEKVVVIGGRMPVWAYGALVHLFHPTRAVGTFEPRVGRGVCVMSHTPELKVGSLIEIEEAEVVEVEYTPQHAQ